MKKYWGYLVAFLGVLFAALFEWGSFETKKREQAEASNEVLKGKVQDAQLTTKEEVIDGKINELKKEDKPEDLNEQQTEDYWNKKEK